MGISEALADSMCTNVALGRPYACQIVQDCTTLHFKFHNRCILHLQVGNRTDQKKFVRFPMRTMERRHTVSIDVPKWSSIPDPQFAQNV